MADFDKMATRIRRKVRPDGRVVDIREPAGDMPVELDGGRIVSLSPAAVRMRGGDVVRVDAYVRTGVVPQVGTDVLVVRKGGFVLVVGEVVML